MNGDWDTWSGHDHRRSAFGARVPRRGHGQLRDGGADLRNGCLLRPGQLLDAKRVVDDLHGIVAMAERSTNARADVTVVTGSDYSVVDPVSTPGATTSTPIPAKTTVYEATTTSDSTITVLDAAMTTPDSVATPAPRR